MISGKFGLSYAFQTKPCREAMAGRSQDNRRRKRLSSSSLLMCMQCTKMEFLPVIPKIGKALDDVFTVFCLRVFSSPGPSATWTWYPAIFPAIAHAFFQGFVWKRKRGVESKFAWYHQVILFFRPINEIDIFFDALIGNSGAVSVWNLIAQRGSYARFVAFAISNKLPVTEYGLAWWSIIVVQPHLSHLLKLSWCCNTCLEG